MEEICAATNTTGAVLLQSDVRTPEVPVTSSVSAYLASYFSNELHVTDIRAKRGVPLLLTGRSVIRDQDLFCTEAEMRRDPLYAHAKEWGLSWWTGVGFRAGSALWALALQRSTRDGPFERADVKALELLPSLLTEAATLSKVVGRQALQESTNALQRVHRPAMAINLLGQVIDMNPSAGQLLCSELQIRNNRLVVRDRTAAEQLDCLVSQLRATSDTSPLLTTPIVVQREGKRPVLINIIPVTGAARAPFLGARVILLLTDLDEVRAPQLETVRRAFGLTHAEARTARLIAMGASTQDISDELEIATETVRKHLKSIFAKTDTHRQAELVALLSRI